MSSVPLSDGCKSPTKMHRTSSYGCASSVTTSIGSKRRLQREAVVVTTCDNSKVAVPQFTTVFLLVTTVLPCFARNIGWITQVMCGGCIIETQFFDVFWSLSFVCHESWQVCRCMGSLGPGGHANRKRWSQRNLRIPSGGSGTYVGAARYHCVRGLSAYLSYLMKVREYMWVRNWATLKHIFGW